MDLTKEKLKEYRALKLEVFQLEREMLEYANSSYVGSPVVEGMPRGSDMSDTTARIAIKTIQLYAELNKKKLEALQGIQEIENNIANLPRLERVVVREHYIMGKDWDEIGGIIGYSLRQTHRLHGRALKKLATSEGKKNDESKMPILQRA